MKKIFLIVFSLVFIPQLVFASWWNPFSWFRKAPEPASEVQVLENRVKELEQELADKEVATPVSKPAPKPRIDPQLKIEQCKARATIEGQKAAEDVLKQPVTPSTCGNDWGCIDLSLKADLAQLEYIRRTTYEKTYSNCLNS